MEKIKINKLPGQTWNRLGMNDVSVDDFPFEDGLKAQIREDGAPWEEKKEALDETREAGFSSMETALGENFTNLLNEAKSARVISFEARPGEQKTYRTEFSFEGGARCARQEFRALPGSQLTIFQYYDGEGKVLGGRAGIQTLIRAQAGANVKLVQIFTALGETECLNDVGAALEEGAALEVDQIFLGGKSTVSGTMVNLTGRKASFASNVAYDLEAGENLDLNLVARHVGKKTEAQMDVKGVLRKGSKKLLRATVDFISGCSGSVGQEAEEVLLMDEEVVNQTIPLILCGEEDVEGAHGASIGRINEEHLFYMKSRGISEEQIYEMLASARIETVLGRIGDEETSERVRKYGKYVLR